MAKEEYDLIVVGAGVTGLAAAMYAARLELRTLCLGSSSGSEFPVGGVITTTNIVENYPGFIRLTGQELAEKSVNLNEASIEQLSMLPGIGIKTAERILAYRKASGRFNSIDELLEVKGIGNSKFDKIKKYIIVR